MSTCRVFSCVVGRGCLQEKKCKREKWLSEETLQITVKRREVKSKAEKEKHKHLDAEFQRIARRDKKAFFKNKKKRKKESLPQQSMQRNRGKQQNGKD